jgi:hypothetical protein
LLRTCYIREGWKIDDVAAERALAYCRKYAEDGSDPDDERMVALDFFCSHGVSLDSVFDGDVGGLTYNLASHSKRADELADAQLLALADKYLISYRKSGELLVSADELSLGQRAASPPLLRPIAWSSPSFLCAGTVLICPHDRAVDHGVLIIRIARQHLKQLLPHPALGPAREARMDLDRVAKAFEQVPPGDTGPIAVDHRLHKQPIVFGRYPRCPSCPGKISLILSH